MCITSIIVQKVRIFTGRCLCTITLFPLTFGPAVLAQLTSVTDGQTDGHPDDGKGRASIASRGKNSSADEIAERDRESTFWGVLANLVWLIPG